MKRFLIIICLAGTAFVNVHSSKIYLHGNLAGTGLMRNQTSPIEAYQNATSVVIAFSVDLGNLDIVVSDHSGSVVFHTMVDATAGSSLSIDTGDWESGSYMISLCNRSDICAEGIFEIDDDDE